MMMKMDDGLYVRSSKRNDTSTGHAAVKGLQRVDGVGMVWEVVDITVGDLLSSAVRVEQAPKNTIGMDRHDTTWSRGMVTSKTGTTTTKRRPWPTGGQTEDSLVDNLPTGPIDLLVVFLVSQNDNGVVASKALLQIADQNRHDHQRQEECHRDHVGDGVWVDLCKNEAVLRQVDIPLDLGLLPQNAVNGEHLFNVIMIWFL